MADPAPLHPVARGHLDVLSTQIGIAQHAKGGMPDPAHGYCTDDVARALVVDMLHARELGWAAVEESADRNVRFLADAFDAASGRFRNLRRWDGSWLDADGSEDADARALEALAEVTVAAPDGPVRASATALFERALPSASRVSAIRPLATVLLACEAIARDGATAAVIEVYRRVGAALDRAFAQADADPSWPWPEPIVTYENELVPRALIVGGRRLGRPGMTRLGLRILDWLIDAQSVEDEQLASVGNMGWWPRGGRPARFDQQPISTTALLLAAEAAFVETGEPRYAAAVEMAYAWFLGRNDAHAPVAVPEAGACADGIGPDGVSLNQGAESTLMWLIALEHVRAFRAGTSTPGRLPSRARVAVA